NRQHAKYDSSSWTQQTRRNNYSIAKIITEIPMRVFTKPAIPGVLGILLTIIVQCPAQTLAYGVAPRYESEKKTALSLRDFLMELQNTRRVNIVFSYTQLSDKTVSFTRSEMYGEISVLLEKVLDGT